MAKYLLQTIRKGQKVKAVKDPKTKERKLVITDKGTRVGVMVAFIVNDKIGIGFSRYHLKKETIKFNPAFGESIAIKRCNKYFEYKSNFRQLPPKFCRMIPSYVKKQFIKFAKRSKKYYKGYELPDWFEFFENSKIVK